MIRDAFRILGMLPLVEWRRRYLSLHHAVAHARAHGRTQPDRPGGARLRLRRVISALDARLPGGGNCVRRALLEMSLDRSAAGEQLLAGLKASGGPRSGHAWLASQPVTDRYDAVISI